MTVPFGLYVILTDPRAGYEQCAAAAVSENVRFVQLRMKNLPEKEVLRTARAVMNITRGSGTRFIVNDSVPVAIEADADGVHLGQHDLDIAAARKMWNRPGKIFGLSTHSMDQAMSAEEKSPDYIGVGPVFKTPTKEVPDPVLGLEKMGSIIDRVDLPAVAIGGINETNLRDVLACGAQNFASVRPVMQTDDPAGEIRKLMRIWADHCEKTV